MNENKKPKSSDGSGSKIYDPGRVGSALGLEILPKNWQIFQFFSLWAKKEFLQVGSKSTLPKVAWPLIYCGSKVSSGWVGPSLA